MAQLLKPLIGDGILPKKLGESKGICIEAICELFWMQPATSDYGGGDCHKSPHELEVWMTRQGWPCVALEIG